MPLLNVTYSQVGTVGVTPSLIYIYTSDPMATVLTTGYLNGAKQLYGNIFSSQQMAIVYTTDGSALMEVIVSGQNVSLQAPINPGNVTLPVVSGHFANFSGTTGLIADLGYLPSNAAKTRVVMADAATVVGQMAVFSDTTGTVSSSATAQVVTRANVTGTTQTIANDTSYTINAGGLCTLTLPATAAVGTIFEVHGSSAAGWTIAQLANQILHVGSGASTTGVGGSVASSNRYDAVIFKCIVANLEWASYGVQGNLTVV